jgi:hypothetical protein
MTVAAGIEIMPKDLLQISSVSQRPAWGKDLAGGPSIGTASAGNPVSANKAWQTVLTSLGVGAPERDAQESTLDECLDSGTTQGQESPTENEGAKPFTSGRASSQGILPVTIPSGQVKPSQMLAGQVGTEERPMSGPRIAAERFSPQKSVMAAGGRGIGSSKEYGTSDSEGSPRKKTSSPALGEAVASLPQMAQLESTLNASQPVQQVSAYATPHLENSGRDKNAFAATQLENKSQPTVSEGQTEPATVVNVSGQEAPSEDLKARGDSGGTENSLPRRQGDGEVLNAGVAATGHAGGHLAATSGRHQDPVFPQPGAVAASSLKPVLETPTVPSGTPLETSIGTGKISADSSVPDTVRAVQGSWSATQASSRNLEDKLNATTKDRDPGSASDSPVAGTGTQSADSSSIPGNLTGESPAVAVDAVVQAHRGKAGKTEGNSRAIQTHASSSNPGTDAFLPSGANATGVVPPAIPSNETTGATAASHSKAGAGEAFTALDAEGANRVTWVRAGAQQAEAGFDDPRLGWVSVRADVSGGSIHASLVPASAEAAQVMGGHLEGLNAYVNEHHSAVETITVAASQSRAHESADAGSPGQGMQERAGQESGQQQSQGNGQGAGGGSAPNRHSGADSGIAGSSATSIGAQNTEPGTATATSASGGRISLMA